MLWPYPPLNLFFPVAVAAAAAADDTNTHVVVRRRHRRRRLGIVLLSLRMAASDARDGAVIVFPSRLSPHL